MVDPTRQDTPQTPAEALPARPADAPAAGPGRDEPAAGNADVAIPSLEERLKAAELQAAEHHDAWLRAKAETDNVRKRAQADIAAANKYAVEKFAASLLPVKDSLEAALASENAIPEALRSGVELTLKQLQSALEKFHVTELAPLGEKFDPHRHEAMTAVESDQPANTVLQVLQKGYLLSGRVIRPARVILAKTREQAVETGRE